MKHLSLAFFLLLGTALAACSGGDPEPAATATDPVAEAGMPSSLWADAPLEGARDVKDVRENAADGDAVVLRGTLQDFGELATFKLVEDSLQDCSEKHDDACPTPWDYCCEDPDAVAMYTVNVEFLDGDVPADWSLEGERGLDHLTEVTVAGTLRKDEVGNLRLEATRIAKQ